MKEERNNIFLYSSTQPNKALVSHLVSCLQSSAVGIETERREGFSISTGVLNPLAQGFHIAVSYLSVELYAKDVHFLMELI